MPCNDHEHVPLRWRSKRQAMNSILLPTDLSETALKGAVYATRLFGTHNSTFTLLHTYADPGLLERAHERRNAMLPHLLSQSSA